MEKLFDIQQLIFDQFERTPFYEREAFGQITLDNHITGLVGPRGIGKTTYLLKQALKAGARENKALYASADNLYFLEHKLIDVVDRVYKETAVRLLCIDEIHKYPNWKQELKNIADTYRDFKVLFTGSSMIDIIHGQYDLSRRVTLHRLHGLSFREFLAFYQQANYPIVAFDELLNNHTAIVQSIQLPEISQHFNTYLRIGYYPFYANFTQDREKYQAIENTIQKTIYEDIATLHSLKTGTLNIIEQLYKYVINSLPGELSAYKLANTLGKNYESTYEYLRILQQAGLIRFLFPKKSGKAYLRTPSKLYPDNCNLLYASYLPQLQDSTIGKVRELFALQHLQNAQHEVFYSKVGDFSVGDHVLEIGGRNKTNKQLKNQDKGILFMDGILTGAGNKIPLYLLGFLY